MPAETYGRRGGRRPGEILFSMNVLVRICGWFLLAQGAVGLGNALFGWWPGPAETLVVVNLLPFLDGYEVFASIVVGVLGFVLLAVARSAAEGTE
jgi:hypothetical protein